jgi:phytol kinase
LIEIEKLQHDLLIFLGAVIYVIATIFIPKILKEKQIISGFTARKIIHSFAGLGVFITPYMYYPIIAVSIAIASTILTKASTERSQVKPLKGLFQAIGEAEELKVGYLQGPFAYCIAITILVFAFVFWPDKYYIPISAILIMMFADTAASIVGKRFGKHKINVPWVGNKRSLEGSLTFVIVGFICSFPVFYLLGIIYPGFSMVLSINQVLMLSFLMSIISSVLELMSPSKYDDLIIPIGCTFITSIIAFLLGIW